MKRLSGVLATMAALLVGLLILGGQAVAAPTDLPVSWGSQVNPGQCQEGTLVINVTYKILRSMDSGVRGNWWAYDYLTRHLQVWQTGDETFCAVVQDTGHFVTVAGFSPGGGDTIAAGLEGTIQGGSRFAITGALRSSSPYRTRGNIGTFDYDCDPDTGTCNSVFRWMDAYFEAGYTYSYEWWGWTYHAGRNGTWVNSQDGNEGDISD